MTLDHVFALAQLVMSIVVTLVLLGRWGGQLESRRRLMTSIEPAAPNGSPSIGELNRRFDDFQAERRTLVRSADLDERLKIRDEENRREHDNLWGAIKDCRAIDSAQQRRIDAMLGQGGS